MRKEKVIAIILAAAGILTMIAGTVLSILLGVLYQNSVSNFFYTQSYFNWQLAAAGILLSLALGLVLIGLSTLIRQFAGMGHKMDDAVEQGQKEEELPRL